MSRTKDESTVNELITEEPKEVVVDSKVESKVTLSANSVVNINSNAKKIGVIRYLQLYPQDVYVEQAMKTQYKTAVKTVAEWDKICASVKKKLGVN